MVCKDMLEENLSFHNEDVLLEGTLIRPDSPGPFPVVIVAHTSAAATRDFGVYQHLAQLLSTVGIAVFLYDRRGYGASTGDFETAAFDDLASDLQAAVNYLKGHQAINPKKIGLWGMSQGGWIATLTASRSADVAFVIAVSAAAVSPAEQMNYSAECLLREENFSEDSICQMLALRNLVDEYYRGEAARDEVQEKMDTLRHEAWYSLAYLDDTLPEDPTTDKWYHILDFDPLPAIQKITIPVLLLYGEIDPWVPIGKSIELWQAYSSMDLAVYQINDANHFMVSSSLAGIRADEGPLVEEYGSVLVHWVRQHVNA